MLQNSDTLLNEATDLLDEIIPVLSRNIQILQNDLNPQSGALQYLLQQEIDHQESLLHLTKELKDKVSDHLRPERPKPTRQYLGDLAVIMENGEEICHRYVSDTFAEAIEKIGVEKVKLLDIEYCGVPMIATFKHHKYKQKPSGNYYIMTNTNTDKKIEHLEEIIERLKLDIQVIDNRSK